MVVDTESAFARNVLTMPGGIAPDWETRQSQPGASSRTASLRARFERRLRLSCRRTVGAGRLGKPPGLPLSDLQGLGRGNHGLATRLQYLDPAQLSLAHQDPPHGDLPSSAKRGSVPFLRGSVGTFQLRAYTRDAHKLYYGTKDPQLVRPIFPNTTKAEIADTWLDALAAEHGTAALPFDIDRRHSEKYPGGVRE